MRSLGRHVERRGAKYEAALLTTLQRSSMLAIIVIKILESQQWACMLRDFITELLHVVGFDLTN